MLRVNFWGGIERIDQPNFPPQHFPTKSSVTEWKTRQKQIKWWVGMKIDLKKVDAFVHTIIRQDLPPQTEMLSFRFTSLITMDHNYYYFWPVCRALSCLRVESFQGNIQTAAMQNPLYWTMVNQKAYALVPRGGPLTSLSCSILLTRGILFETKTRRR